MKAQLAARKLSTDLSQLKTLKAQEKKAVAAIQVEEKQVVDTFLANPSISSFMRSVGKLFSLGQKDTTARDHFETAIAADKKDALKLLPQAKPALSFKQFNTDRVALGLKPISHRPPTHRPVHPPPSHAGEPWKKGPGQLAGSDTSHYQSQGTFESAIRNTQFAAIKATEGTRYTDPAFKARWAELGRKIDQGKMSLRVAYCFLDKGNGAGQAKHFLDAMGIHGKLKAGTRLALDWEASALSSPQTLKDAANYVHKVTGLWPMVYTSASRVAQARAAVPHAPMWEAKWSNGKADHNVPFVQYSDGPGYDHDVFNGTKDALRKFAGF